MMFRDDVPSEWVTASTRAGLMGILPGFVSCKTPGSRGGTMGPWTINYTPGYGRETVVLTPGMEITPVPA